MIILAAAGAFGSERRRLRAHPNADLQRAFAASVERALHLDPAQPKFVNFDWQASGQATRVALYLERKGIGWWVREDWPLLYGAERILTPGRTDEPVPTLSSSFWHVGLHPNMVAMEGNTTTIPLTPEFDLVIRPGR
jgi:hypothetical protein